MKKCLTCKFQKDDNLFGPHSVKCIDCVNAERRATNAEMRRRVLEQYNSKCACCGEDEPLFLDLDHINNDGNLDRARGNRVTWKQAFLYPDNFQILCKNCNGGKALNKSICPHQTKGK